MRQAGDKRSRYGEKKVHTEDKGNIGKKTYRELVHKYWLFH
jgi:hypothetical protein